MATYYVAKTGNNSNDGSSGAPWLTIGKAMSAALVPGDTVIVRDGTYNEMVTVSKSGSAAGGYITVRSENLYGAKVSIPAGSAWGVGITGHYVRLERFEVFGSPASGITARNTHHVDILDNISRDNETGGIFANKSDFLLIEGNICYGNARRSAISGISVLFATVQNGDTTTGGFRIIIRGNMCYDNKSDPGQPTTDGHGIILDRFYGTGYSYVGDYTYPALCENNVCFHNGGSGITAVDTRFATIRNNTCWHNNRTTAGGSTWAGELQNQISSNNIWANNIGVCSLTVNPNSSGIANVGTGNANIEYYNNLTFNGNPGQTAIYRTGSNQLPTAADGNKLGVDPLLVNPSTDPSTANFRLGADSPCINAGTAAAGTGSVDYDGNTRVVGGTIDMGAFESFSAATVQPDATGYGNGGGGTLSSTVSGAGSSGVVMIRYPYDPGSGVTAPTRVGGALVLNTSAASTAGPPNTYTASTDFTVTGGASNCLIAVVEIQQGNTFTDSEVTVTAEGVAMTAAVRKAHTSGIGFPYIGIFYKMNPSAGATTIVASFGSKDGRACVMQVEEWTGLASSPLGTTAATQGSRAPDRALVPAATDSLVVSGVALADGDSAPFSPDANVTERVDLSTGSVAGSDLAAFVGTYITTGVVAVDVGGAATGATGANQGVFCAAEFKAA